MINKDEPDTDDSHATKSEPFRIRLPGFISETAIGLGDAIKRATSLVGIKSCADCQHRAAIMNTWVVFDPRAPR